MEKRQPSGMAGQESGVRWEQGRLPGGGREKTRLGRGRTAERSRMRGCSTVIAPGPEPGRAGAHTQALPPPTNPAAPRTQQLRLVLGLHVLGENSLTSHIRKVVRHPEYKPVPHLENDLALLKVLPVGGMVVPDPLPLAPLPYCPLPQTHLPTAPPAVFSSPSIPSPTHLPLPVPIAGREGEAQQDHPAPGVAPRAPGGGHRHPVQRGRLGPDPPAWEPGQGAAGAGLACAGHQDVQQQSVLAWQHQLPHDLPGS